MCVLDQRGFTLIELLVVIIVLGLLVGLVGPRLFGRVGQSKMAAARAQIELLGAALDQYRLDIGSYPNAGQGLDALNRNPNVNNWNGPYLKRLCPRIRGATSTSIAAVRARTGSTTSGPRAPTGPRVAKARTRT